MRRDVAAVQGAYSCLEASFGILEGQQQNGPRLALELAERVPAGRHRQSDDECEEGLAQLRRSGDDAEPLDDMTPSRPCWTSSGNSLCDSSAAVMTSVRRLSSASGGGGSAAVGVYLPLRDNCSPRRITGNCSVITTSPPRSGRADRMPAVGTAAPPPACGATALGTSCGEVTVTGPVVVVDRSRTSCTCT